MTSGIPSYTMFCSVPQDTIANDTVTCKVPGKMAAKR
jgi:hypothetical protein